VPFKDSIEGLSGDIFDVFIKPYFKDNFRPLKKGDIFIARGGMRAVEFKVTDIEHKDDDNNSEFCIVGTDTEVFFDESKSLGREEDERLNEIGYDDIGFFFFFFKL
jgi:transitional endoplasmic reticulum ATPase